MVAFARAARIALFVTLLAQGSAFAQGKGGNGNGGLPPNVKMPSKDEIAKKAKEILGKSETASCEIEGFAKFTYKAIPTSSDEVAKTFGEQYKAQIPQGVDIDSVLRQFGPQIQEAMDTYLTEPEGWKFEALADLKIGSKTVKKGEYKVTLTVEGEVLKSVLLTQGEEGKKPTASIRVNLAPQKADKKAGEQTYGKLKFAFEAVMAKGEATKDFHLDSEFFRTKSKSKEPFKPTEPKKEEPKKDEPKKDEPKK